jgi:predicted transcriptional regulator
MVNISDMITSRQLKAGRHLAGLSQAALAQLSGISSNTIAKVEAKTCGRYETVGRIIAALEHAGVQFSNGGVQIGAISISHTKGGLSG